MHQNGKILFVDDEESMRALVQIALERDGHSVDTAADGQSALEMFDATKYDMVIHDLKMPGMDGIELLSRLRERDPSAPVVIITAFSTWDTAVEAMRLGAYDYLKKPFDNDDVRALVQRALQLKRSQTEAAADRAESAPQDVHLIGSTPAVQEILALVRRVAPTSSTVVIEGESGTGKEMIARLLHLQSLRRQQPFISVNCGAFSETLLESEIFGHRKGAFTGAVSDKQGLLEIADGGTFFLDEVGEMSLPVQIKLLRVLETREFLPVGEVRPHKADVRFIAATNRDLSTMVRSGAFREDLYYRLNVIPVFLPPLRERRDDIPLLAGHFLAIYNHAFGRGLSGFSDAAMQALLRNPWAGNIRELQNTIQRAVTLCPGEIIQPEDIAAPRSRNVDGEEPPALVSIASGKLPEKGIDLEQKMAEIEAGFISEALKQTDGNLTKAAELLNISFRSIRYKVKKMKLK
jgi:two-component system response regulator PilR (NtrC family)